MFQIKVKETFGLALPKILLGILLSCFAFPIAADTETVTFEIYLSPNGDDANSGLTAGQAIVSLNQAHQILLDYQPQVPVDIIIESGTYNFQTIEWTYTNNNEIVLRAKNETAERPIFDGQGISDTWFSYNGRSGQPSNLKFLHLKVQNYNMGMSFKADRNNIERGNSHNTLESMYFYRIGGHYSSMDASFAAVRFVNSDFNQITNSHFVDILNPGETANLIHAVYMAHHSSNNYIAHNEFTRINGAPIQVRDLSNHNVVEFNRFERAGNEAIFQEWYCQSGRDECTKPTKECPSFGNVFSSNELGQGFYGAVSVSKLWYSSDFCGSNQSPRLQAVANISVVSESSAAGVTIPRELAQPSAGGAIGSSVPVSLFLLGLALIGRRESNN